MRPPAPPRPTFLNDAAMVFLRTSGLAALLCVLYIAFGNERAGFILLGALSIASLAAGVTVVLAYRDDAAVLEAAPEGAPAVRPVRFGRLPAPSGVPVAGAAAVALLAAGLLYGPSIVIVGVVVGLITVFVVSAVAAGEHRNQTLNLLPVAIPIVAFAVIGSFMFLMSRILLAVNADLSTGFAILAAVSILAGGFLVANRPQVPTRTLVRLAAGLTVLFSAGGLAAYGVGQRPEERKAGPPPETVVAKNIAFEQKHLHWEAGTAVTVDFKNEDVNVPHNIDFTVDQAGAASFYKKDPLPGPISDTYAFTAPKAGEYFYHCDVHPNMTGTVSVTGAGGPEPSQVAAPTTIASKGPATSAAARAETTTTSKPKATPAAAGPATIIDLAAKNIEFDKKTMTFKANSPVVIHFDNLDAVPHNVDITTESGGGGTKIFKEDPFSGPKTVDYRFTAPGPGRLYYLCDVHPNMTGTINVQ